MRKSHACWAGTLKLLSIEAFPRMLIKVDSIFCHVTHASSSSSVISWLDRICSSQTLLQLRSWKKMRFTQVPFGRWKQGRDIFLWLWQLLLAGMSLEMLGLSAAMFWCCSLTPWELSGSSSGPNPGSHLCHCVFELNSSRGSFQTDSPHS